MVNNNVESDGLDLDNFTLMMAIQAVNGKIKRYEQMLKANSMSDKEEILSLLNSYKKASARLQKAYMKSHKPRMLSTPMALA